MTIAVIWQEDGVQWCAADTRIVAGKANDPKTEIGTKIFSIPVRTSALAAPGVARQAHYWTQYGFVFAGASAPASMTAITASTLLQSLARPGDLMDPPTFEQIAEFVTRLAKRFMQDRRWFGDSGLFTAVFFGWCPHANDYRLAHIDGRDDCGSFRVDLSYPARPQVDGDPWLVLGDGAATFNTTLANYKLGLSQIHKRVPRRVIDKMVAEGADRTVGGATSIGMAYQGGFELMYALEPVEQGKPAARAIFNGLDMATDIGQVGEYSVAITGLA